MTRSNLSEFAGRREGITLAMLVAVIVISGVLNHDFLSTLNASFVLTGVVEIGLMSLVMTALIVMGDVDLSVGSTLGMCAAVLGELVAHGVPFVLAAILCLLTGVVAGLINGFLCVGFGLPSLVVTLGTFGLFRGIAELVIGANTVTNFPNWFLGWNSRYAFSTITYPQLFWLVCTVIAIVLLHRFRVGRLIYFIGANPLAARYSGIRVDRTKIIVFAVSGLMAAVAALTLTSTLESADNSMGLGFELIVITAVLLGGTDFRGGRGTIIGTTLAVLFIGVIENGLEILNVAAQTVTAIIGALLILSIGLDLGFDIAMNKLASRRIAREEISIKGNDRPVLVERARSQ